MGVKNNNYASMRAAEWRGKVGETLDTLEENSKEHGESIKKLTESVLLIPLKFAEYCEKRRGVVEKRISTLETAEAKRNVVQKVKRGVWAFIGSIIGGLVVVLFALLVKKIF